MLTEEEKNELISISQGMHWLQLSDLTQCYYVEKGEINSSTWLLSNIGDSFIIHQACK